MGKLKFQMARIQEFYRRAFFFSQNKSSLRYQYVNKYVTNRKFYDKKKKKNGKFIKYNES